MSTLLTSPLKSADKFQEQMLPPLSAIILAGGEGRRMGGADKGLVEYQGKPLVQWVKEALPDHVDQVVISCNRNEAIYAAYGQTVHDLPSRETYAGALAGILAALEACTHDWVIITPCDLIYYPTHFAKYAWAALTAHQKLIRTPVELWWPMMVNDAKISAYSSIKMSALAFKKHLKRAML